MLRKANITWTAKQVTKSITKGNITFDNIVQRSYVWEKWRKSALIHSMVFGYPIPPFYAAKANGGYDMFDGQQRMLTISTFINDEWELGDLPMVEYESDETGDMVEYDISGKKFSELPEELQDMINSYCLTVYYYENITQAEITEMFKRLNNGRPLSSKSRALASCQQLAELLSITNCRLFNDMLTDKGKANKNQVIIAMKLYCMITMSISDIDFGSKKFNALLEETELAEDDIEMLKELFDYIADVHDELVREDYKGIARRVYTETHLISLTPFLYTMCGKNESAEIAADFIRYIFETDDNRTTVSDEYNEAASNGVAKNSSITARHRAIKSLYDEFFSDSMGN